MMPRLLAVLAILGCGDPARSQSPGPINLSLDAGSPGQPPTGWFPGNPILKVEFRTDGCQSGAGCAVVHGPETATPGAFGNLMQSGSAVPHRGKILVFRGAVRVETEEKAGVGQMWFRVDRDEGVMGAFDNMGDRPVRPRDWTFHEIFAEIAEDATRINFGIMALGKATVWADSFSLEEWKPSAEEAQAREAIQRLYTAADAAAAAGDMAGAIERIMLPDGIQRANRQVVTRARMIESVRAAAGAGAKITGTTRVWHTRVSADQATVRVTQRGSLTSGADTKVMESTSRDTWVRTADGWKLKETESLSMREVPRPVDPAVTKRAVEELKSKAVPLVGVGAGKPYPDLAAFGKAVGDARIVALGEATHGTREIFQMKHRLFEYLVREKGFTVFAFEANWPESEAANRYVKGDDGDPAAAIKAMYFWTWHTAEVRDLLDWMRAYNKEHGNKLSFTSFDMQTAGVALAKAVDYAKKTLPSETVPADAAQLAAWMESRREALVQGSSAAAYRDALQAARVAGQAATLRIQSAPSYRDEMMAKNVEWLANEAFPGEKIVLWAHNGHVSRSTPHFKPMGNWLDKAYGRNMYVLGFAIHTGEVRAMTTAAGKRIGLATSPIPPSPEGTGAAALSSAGLPLFFLDMRSQTGALKAWLKQPHRFRSCGALWSRDDPGMFLTSETLADSYDGLIFLEKTSAAQGLQ